MPETTKEGLEVSRFIRASREQLFAALTGQDRASQWFCPEECTLESGESDARAGGAYRAAMVCNGQPYTAYGTYKEIIPNEKLVFTHQWKEPNSTETLVTIELKDKSGGTHVTLTHTGFDDAAEARGHQEGWASTLRNLEKRFK